MASINESLTSDLLFNIFKRLNLFQTTRIRRVCKLWLQIIDEHKSFWRILHLPKNSLRKWDPSILELFDRKSDSTLQDVNIEVKVGKKHREQIINILKKSRQSLKYLFLKLREPFGPVEQDLLESFPAVNSLRVVGWSDSCRVRLRRPSNKRDSQKDGSNTASLLKVLWYRVDRSILEIDNARFKNLVSLVTTVELSSSEWRELLEGPSRNLKHLRLGFMNKHGEDHSRIPTLYLPKLEVLEINTSGDYPQWLLIPDSAKLIIHSIVINLPSISELWSWDSITPRNDIINRLPKLETLCLLNLYSHVDGVLGFLKDRRYNVKAGLQVDGVKMEMIKRVVLPFDLSDPGLSDQKQRYLRTCQKLVQVVEGNSFSRFIDVEL